MAKIGIRSYFYEIGENKDENGDFRLNLESDGLYPHEALREAIKERIKSVKPFGKAAFIYVASPSLGYSEDKTLPTVKSNVGYIASCFAREFKYDFSLLEIDANLCGSGASAIKKAQTLLNADFDSVAILGANFINPDTKKIFSELKIDMPLCEAYACFILSKNGFKKEISGANVTANLKDSSPLSVSKEGYLRSLKWAKNLNIYGVKAHATPTKANECEAVAIKTIFGDIKTLGYKERIGHSLDISALAELGLFLDEDRGGRWLFSASGFGNIYASFAVNRAD